MCECVFCHKWLHTKHTYVPLKKNLIELRDQLTLTINVKSFLIFIMAT